MFILLTICKCLCVCAYICRNRIMIALDIRERVNALIGHLMPWVNNRGQLSPLESLINVKWLYLQRTRCLHRKGQTFYTARYVRSLRQANLSFFLPSARENHKRIGKDKRKLSYSRNLEKCGFCNFV